MNGGDGTVRKVKIVIEDDGSDKFRMYLEGDIERLSMPQIPVSLLSAAEFWGSKLFKICQTSIEQSMDVKTMNRKERRQNGKS